MITDKEFIKEENKEELSSVIESFLNRLKAHDWAKATHTNNEPVIQLNEATDSLIITDKAKARIIKEMIKDFKEYKI